MLLLSASAIRIEIDLTDRLCLASHSTITLLNTTRLVQESKALRRYDSHGFAYHSFPSQDVNKTLTKSNDLIPDLRAGSYSICPPLNHAPILSSFAYHTQSLAAVEIPLQAAKKFGAGVATGYVLAYSASSRIPVRLSQKSAAEPTA